MSFSPFSSRRCKSQFFLGALLAVLIATASTFAATTTTASGKRVFDIPAGGAEAALKLFSEQSRNGVIFSTDGVKGVRTNPVHGTFTVREALDLLVARTGLVIQYDERAGAFSVSRAPAPAARPMEKKTAAVDDEREDPLQLSPFVVSTEKDRGYAATNTLAGTRLNTEIANTPASLSVLTRDFLNDIGAIDVNQAMEYALNAVNNTTDFTGNGATWGAFTYRVRGFLGGTNSRNYFRSAFLGDGYNLDSVELSRGPNSILFGIGSPGGAINYSTKKARPGHEITQVQLRVGSFEDYRGTVDVARSFGKNERFAVRVNAVYQDASGYYDFEEIERKAATVAATWRPFRHTTVRAEFENGKFHDERARPFAVGDNFSDWIAAGRPLATAYGVVPTATSVGGGASGVFVAPQSPLGTAGVFASANFFRISNSNVPTGLSSDRYSILDRTIVPRNANLLGPGGGNDTVFNISSITIEQRVGRNLFLELAYARQARTNHQMMPGYFSDNQLSIDVNTTMPTFDPMTGARIGAAPNPNVGRFLARGTYNESRYSDISHDYRWTVGYDLDLGRLGRHRMAGLLQRTKFEGDQRLRREVNRAANRRNASLLSNQNSITRISYIDFASSDPAFRGLHEYRAFPVRGKLLDSTFDVESGLAMVGWAGNRNVLESAIIADQSSLWNERIWLTAGIRRDHVRNLATTPIQDEVSQEFVGLAWTNRNLDVYDTTNSLGLVVHVTPWLSVYGNRSGNFNTQGTLPLFGETGTNALPDNVRGRGQDVGIRSKLFGGRINFSAGYYVSEQLGQRFAVNGQFGNLANLMWSAVGQPRPTIIGDDLRDTKSEGYEFELTANATKNLRLTFNYAHAVSFAEVRHHAHVIAYLEAAKPVWLSPANASIPIAGAQQGRSVQELWDFMRRQLSLDMATNGMEPFGFRPDSANFFGRYAFTEGRLRNVAVGLGANYRGRMVLGYRNGSRDQLISGYRQFMLNALLSYDLPKLRRKTYIRMQLNVDNVLGFDDPFPRRYNWFDATQSATVNFSYPLPRRWSVTTSLTF